MELEISDFQLRRPHWRGRNKLIAGLMEPNKSVIDLGCGAKNLLWYYRNPLRYLGLDGMPIEEVDMVVDLDSDWRDTVEHNWDYSVNSGILEWCNGRRLLKHQKGIAKEYIFTWWPASRPPVRASFDAFESWVEEDYIINEVHDWGPQKVYKCVSL